MNLSKQLQASMREEARLLHHEDYVKTWEEHKENTQRRINAMRRSEDLRIEILRSDAAFMAMNGQFAGNSEFAAMEN